MLIYFFLPCNFVTLSINLLFEQEGFQPPTAYFLFIIFKDRKSLLNLLLLSSLYTDRMCCEHMTLSRLSLAPADSLMPNWSASCFSAIWMIIRDSKARRQSAG